MNFDKYIYQEPTIEKPIELCKCSECGKYCPDAKYCPECGQNLAYRIKISKEWIAARNQQRCDQTALSEAFAQDVLKESGFQDHPKAREIFLYAWDGSGGYASCFETLEELYDLFMVE